MYAQNKLDARRFFRPQRRCGIFLGPDEKNTDTQIPGEKLWTFFSTVSECLKNSLPVDWASLITNWTSEVLNLTGGINDVDESGEVFEISRYFVSICTPIFGELSECSLGCVSVGETFGRTKLGGCISQHLRSRDRNE